ncbi:CENP-Q, a CENPA-CAD centromere complex subunit-domain-containing protein [Glomus cerebriforme]|uniref:CENP-Q, a CENPA-CAD centromere complex subunit-domain-containing protein n=1 Tax=Glomus cerebriforme TaxID=658196 RepID=A0A397TFP7_9GLOM|nr:CENP-Q, a CENPA-CAD centromere complex subunit-domain-containing protein [Glomus cerebriforme]
MVNNSDDINEDSDHEGFNEEFYRYRFVSQNTVDKNWKPLSAKSRQHIHDLVLSSVPTVLNNTRGIKRKADLQDLLDKLISKIDEKLETLQVPKTSKNINFDYSKLHSQNRSLELTLAQELDQISKMEMQLEHEKLLLKEDTRSLTKFRSDKKAVNSRNKMLQRNKLHPLLKEELEDAVEIDEELIKSHFKPLKNKSSCLYDPEKDDQLCEIEKSLSLHLRSIEKNTQPIDDLVNEVDEAGRGLMQLMKSAGLEDKLFDKVFL